MKLTLALLLVLIGVAAAPAAQPKATSFEGKYEAVERGKSVLGLDVQKTRSGFDVSFSAANEDGSGAAPDGGGVGKLNARGELAFAFEDSFGNKGRGVLKRAGEGFIVMLTLTTTEDPRAAVHYGERRLKRLPTSVSKTR